jgi:hypothetical protein
MSLLATVTRDVAFHRRILGSPRSGAVIQHYSSANVAHARNECVRDFLDGTEADWLWFVDSDMSWEEDAFERLLAHADAEKAPIVGALCFTTARDEDGAPRLVPTMYGWTENPGGGVDFYRYLDFDDDVMLQVGATGAAFMLIHRSVLVAMREAAEQGRPSFSKTFPWFQETELAGKPCGEDITFCARAGMLGFPVWVHTGVDVGHHKDRILNREGFRAQQAVAS